MSRERIHFLSLLSVLLRSFYAPKNKNHCNKHMLKKNVSEVAMRKRQVANM